MRHPKLIGLGALLALLAAAPAADGPPRIAGFKAFLFNSRTGTLSADVLADTGQLGNVVAGDLASVSTFVVVTVSFGAHGALPPAGARVRLVATTAGRPPRVLLDRASRLGPVAADGTTRVGFWLDDTGCTPITLRASLIGGRAAATGQADLPFACYE